MKLIISENELYPYYRIYQKGDEIPTSIGPRAIDIPQEKVEWIKKIEKEFERLQEYLEGEFEKGKDVDRSTLPKI